MGLPKIIIGLIHIIVLTFMVSSSVSHKIWVRQTTSHDDEQVHSTAHHASPTLPPRKLKHHEEAKVKTVENKNYMPSQVKEQAFPGKLRNKERAEMEGEIDPSQLFTMDYRPVTRRRPVHNMVVPMAP